LSVENWVELIDWVGKKAYCWDELIDWVGEKACCLDEKIC
jgi:hypothetical protein